MDWVEDLADNDFLSYDYISASVPQSKLELIPSHFFPTSPRGGSCTPQLEVEFLVTGRNEVVAKVMFLQVSVILSTGGGSPENPPGTKENPPDQADTPPGTKENPPRTGRPPLDQADTPPGPRRTPPRPRRTPPDQGEPPRGRRLQHAVNERSVRILLECILG